MKSVPDDISLSKDLFHLFLWSTEPLILHPGLLSGHVKGQHLEQHRIQYPQSQMVNTLGKCEFVVGIIIIFKGETVFLFND